MGFVTPLIYILTFTISAYQMKEFLIVDIVDYGNFSGLFNVILKTNCFFKTLM